MQDVLRYEQLLKLGGSSDIRISRAKSLVHLSTARPDEDPAIRAEGDARVVVKSIPAEEAFHVDCCVSCRPRAREAVEEIIKVSPPPSMRETSAFHGP